MPNKMAHPSERIKEHNIWRRPRIWKPCTVYNTDYIGTSGRFLPRLRPSICRSPWVSDCGAARRHRAVPAPGRRPSAAPRGAGPANQRPRGGRSGGASRAVRRAKQRRLCRPAADDATLTRALAVPAAAAAGPGPRAPRRGRPAPRLWSVPARALSGARALPRARDPGARRVRLLRALPGCRGRALRGLGRRALRPRAGVRQPRRRGGARGHRALRVRAARHGVRVRRPLLPQRLRTAPARPARSWKAPWPPAQGARWPLRIW